MLHVHAQLSCGVNQTDAPSFPPDDLFCLSNSSVQFKQRKSSKSSYLRSDACKRVPHVVSTAAFSVSGFWLTCCSLSCFLSDMKLYFDLRRIDLGSSTQTSFCWSGNSVLSQRRWHESSRVTLFSVLLVNTDRSQNELVTSFCSHSSSLMSRGSKVNLQFLDGGGEEVHHLFSAGLSAFILFV